MDDVVQSVFEAFAEDAEKIAPRAAASWLQKVTRRKVIDYARRHREELSDPPEPPSEEPDPEHTLRSKQLSAAVRRAMEEVVSSRRRILAAVSLEGRSVAEVARETGVSESTLQSRLEQGGRDLRAVMEREREKERFKSGGFTSWGWMLALVDWLRRASRTRWFHWGLAVTGASAIIGGIVGWTSGGETLAPTVEELPAVTFEAPTLVLPVSAPAERGVDRPEVVRPLLPRTHHDIHRHFEQEAFGAP